MRSEIHFTHMDRSPAVEDYATARLDSIITEFLNRKDAHWQAWMVAEKSTESRGPHVFRCEVSVRYAPKKEVFVSKEATDMYDAINMAVGSLTEVIREETKREQQRKRRAARRENVRVAVAVS
ncbi:MAG: HPF/RaiA family ribosome-associated protein [Pseudobdellovibrionaceae bacterium]